MAGVRIVTDSACDLTDDEATTLGIEVVNLREELPPFYEKFGYKAVETIPFDKPGKLTRDAHMVRMSKTL